MWVTCMLFLIINMIIALIFGLLSMAVFTLLERRGLGYAQLRKGPVKASFMGLLLPLADAVKLFSKARVLNAMLNKVPFVLGPLLALFCSVVLWLIIPIYQPHSVMGSSVVFFLAVSGIHVYSLLAMGWSSNSKYSSIGMVRGIAQTLSYEISMALVFIILLFPVKVFSLASIGAEGFSLGMVVPFIVMVWVVSCIAETNRTPFDVAEGESELVSGFNTEYAGGGFALIFMSEYLGILVVSSLSVLLFLFPGTPNGFFCLKIFTISLFSLLFIGLRASLPRMRYDSLMWLAWGCVLPLVILGCIFIMPVLSVWVG